MYLVNHISHEQDMTEGEFVSEEQQVLIQSFSSWQVA